MATLSRVYRRTRKDVLQWKEQPTSQRQPSHWWTPSNVIGQETLTFLTADGGRETLLVESSNQEEPQPPRWSPLEFGEILLTIHRLSY